MIQSNNYCRRSWRCIQACTSHLDQSLVVKAKYMILKWSHLAFVYGASLYDVEQFAAIKLKGSSELKAYMVCRSGVYVDLDSPLKLSHRNPMN